MFCFIPIFHIVNTSVFGISVLGANKQYTVYLGCVCCKLIDTIKRSFLDYKTRLLAEKHADLCCKSIGVLYLMHNQYILLHKK